jgi:predicted ATPase
MSSTNEMHWRCSTPEVQVDFLPPLAYLICALSKESQVIIFESCSRAIAIHQQDQYVHDTVNNTMSTN